jgi:hypothetical protein
MYFLTWNVETPYRSLRGQQAARLAYGGAGLGCWKKRMPGCNGSDTGLNVTRHESEPTSDGSYLARKSEQLFSWGKADDDNGNVDRCILSVCKHVKRTQMSIAKATRRNKLSYRVTMALVRLEPCAVKVACTVLRGLGAGNRPWLLDWASNSSQSQC